jgi:hypothetical protein
VSGALQCGPITTSLPPTYTCVDGPLIDLFHSFRLSLQSARECGFSYVGPDIDVSTMALWVQALET